MEILASCSIEESSRYDGSKLMIDREDGGKPDKVVLNIVVNEGDTSVLQRVNSNVKCVTFTSLDIDFSTVDLSEVKFDVFQEFNLGDTIVEQGGVTPLLRVPDGYSDMRNIWNICNNYPTLRVIGGNLLQIDGVRIGRYSAGKEKGSPVYNGIYDQFLEIPLIEIGNLHEVVKKARKKLETSSSEKKTKTPKEKKPAVKRNDVSKAFSSLFGDIEEEDF